MPARRPISRPGTTLLEGLIASVLLATSVVGISGALAATYQNQQASQARNLAILNGRSTLESVTALPLDRGASGSAAIADYQTSTGGSGGTAGGGNSLVANLLAALGIRLQIGGGSGSSGTSSPSADPAAPVVSVDRRATLNGSTSATGDFATVSVVVPTTGSQTVTLRRVVSRAESAANQVP